MEQDKAMEAELEGKNEKGLRLLRLSPLFCGAI